MANATRLQITERVAWAFALPPTTRLQSLAAIEIDGLSMPQVQAIVANCAVAISIMFVIPERAMALESMFVFVQQADSPGNDYSRIDHSSFEKCELSCERDVACNAFTYNQIKGECFLGRLHNGQRCVLEQSPESSSHRCSHRLRASDDEPSELTSFVGG
jgi:hypothetical protein